MIISRTPFRISFFGGGTDYPAWYRENGGQVLGTAINKYCWITCRYLPPFFEHRTRVAYSKIELAKANDEVQHPAVRGVLQYLNMTEGLEIHHDGDLPARSGLGSSSAFTVGLLRAIHAMRGHHTSNEALASEAIHVEHCMLREPVGLQDQISAAFGGFNHITFRADGRYEVEPIIMPRERLAMLQDHLMLVFTGISRLAPVVAQTVIDNLKRRTSELKAMQEMVGQAIELLSSASADIVEFGRLLNESWTLKRGLSDRVSSVDVDALYETAMRAGAVGGKLLGAGGGGFVLLFVRPEDRVRVCDALRTLITVPFKFDMSGCRIALYQPDGL